MERMPTLVVAGTQSGVGKTAIALGLMRALRRRGLRVQPFKVGPDFIDPGHHAIAAGRPSANLDGWMLSQASNQALFARHCQGADVAIVEGVMGLFDGYGDGGEGSTAQMAAWLGAPIVLVGDVRGTSRSAIALFWGFTEFDPSLDFAGIVCNRVAGAGHLERIRAAAGDRLRVPILGGIPRDDQVTVPSRNLGLWMAVEDRLGEAYIDRLADLVDGNLNLGKLLAQARSHPVLPQEPSSPPLLPRGAGSQQPSPPGKGLGEGDRRENPPPAHSPVRIGIARDEAFCFYYADNLAGLRELGAELVEFSPRRDRLPPNLHSLYLGGGYPELYARDLAANHALLADIRQFHQQQRPIYAECGGLIYVSQGCVSQGLEHAGSDLGTTHPHRSQTGGDRLAFVGLLPFWTRMVERLKLGYAEIVVSPPEGTDPARVPLPVGAIARGHRFHRSEIIDFAGFDPPQAPATLDPPGQPVRSLYQVTSSRGDTYREGYWCGSLLASYVHLHFASCPAIAQFLIQSLPQP